MLMWIPLYLYPEQDWVTIVYYLTSAFLGIAMSSHALAHEEFEFDASVLSTSDADIVGTDDAAAQESDVTASQHVESVRPLWVTRLDMAMEERCLYQQANLTLSQLADEIGVNRTYLSLYFNRSEVGSFYNFIASYRIEDAKKRLEDTSLPLNEIARMSGFTSQANFSRTFKNNVGVTPTEYRKNYIKE